MINTDRNINRNQTAKKSQDVDLIEFFSDNTNNNDNLSTIDVGVEHGNKSDDETDKLINQLGVTDGIGNNNNDNDDGNSNQARSNVKSRQKVSNDHKNLVSQSHKQQPVVRASSNQLNSFEFHFVFVFLWRILLLTGFTVDFVVSMYVLLLFEPQIIDMQIVI